MKAAVRKKLIDRGMGDDLAILRHKINLLREELDAIRVELQAIRNTLQTP
jgi:hypothetical protein